MTGATASVPTSTTASGMLAFVWAAWRATTPGHFRLAIAVGLLLGASHGIGQVLLLRGAPWTGFLGGFLPTVTQVLALALGFAVAARVTTTRLPRWAPYAVAAALATMIAAVVEWGCSYLAARAAGAPWDPHFRKVLGYVTGELPTMLLVGVLAAFGVMYAIDAERRTKVLRTLQLERARITRQAYEARLQALQARIEPRFLFNTLADIEALYETDAAEAAHMLDDLIVYLRAALPGLEDPSSTLGTEFTLVRTWLDIARIRSRGRLAYALPDTAALADVRMPPMLLVPLAQHAVACCGEAGDDRCAVYMSADQIGSRLRIVITGPVAAFTPTNEAPAIVAIRERLFTLYGTDAQLTLEAVEQGLSRATLEIPHAHTERHPR